MCLVDIAMRQRVNFDYLSLSSSVSREAGNLLGGGSTHLNILG